MQARLSHTLDADDPAAPPLGLIVLQTDETIEPEIHHYMTGYPGPVYVSRVRSGPDVTHDMLSAMETDLPAAADLLPKARRYPVVGYGCTSGSSVIGSDRVEKLVQRSCDAAYVTNPLRAATAHAAALGISKFALVSPYVEEVNEPLRAAFARGGIAMDVFASFGISEEAKVVRISTASVVDAAVALARDSVVEGVFLSCTNLRTLAAIPEIEARTGKPVLSSNRSLAWHMREIVGAFAQD